MGLLGWGGLPTHYASFGGRLTAPVRQEKLDSRLTIAGYTPRTKSPRLTPGGGGRRTAAQEANLYYFVLFVKYLRLNKKKKEGSQDAEASDILPSAGKVG